MTACPDPTQLLELVDRDGDAARNDSHVRTCAPCHAAVERLLAHSLDFEPPPLAPELARRASPWPSDRPDRPARGDLWFTGETYESPHGGYANAEPTLVLVTDSGEDDLGERWYGVVAVD